MKKLFPTNDKTKYALVDDDVYETIQQMGLKFCIDKRKGYWYSTTEIQLPGMIKKKHLLLHRLVWILKTGELPNKTIDHIDINKSNNQYYNLRLATAKEQQHNQGKRKSNTSGYIGVSHYHQVDKRGNGYDYWLTRIYKPDGHREAKKFPYTDDGLIAAAHWRDKKAREYHGDFVGKLNFPDEK